MSLRCSRHRHRHRHRCYRGVLLWLLLWRLVYFFAIAWRCVDAS